MTGQTLPALPVYVSHKRVHAAKITLIENIGLTPGARLHFPDGIQSVTVNEVYMVKHEPKVGGYYVVYPDGYESWSPSKAFEEGYTLLPPEPTSIAPKRAPARAPWPFPTSVPDSQT